MFFINFKSLLRKTSPYKNLLKKIKFPHGAFNTIEELMFSRKLPQDSKQWELGLSNKKNNHEEIQISNHVFEKERCSNVYRYFFFFYYSLLSFSFFAGVYVKTDVCAAYLALLSFRREMYKLTNLGKLL